MDELLTDAQQADIVRKWLRENGPYLFGGLVLALSGLFGWNQWQDFNDNKAEEASALYQQLVAAITSERNTEADEYLKALAAGYRNSPYLDQARLYMAKLQMDRNETDAAADYLAQVVADSPSSEIRNIARLRLARVRLHQQYYDAALAVLVESDSDSSFSPRYHDVRGDVYLAMNQPDSARIEYQAALDAERQEVIDRGFIQAKLDSLGVDEIELHMDSGTIADDTQDEPPADSDGDEQIINE